MVERVAIVEGTINLGVPTPTPGPWPSNPSRSRGRGHRDPPFLSSSPAALAAEARAEGPEVGSVEEQLGVIRVTSCLGSCPRGSATRDEHSLGKLRQKKHHAQALAQLQETLELVRAQLAFPTSWVMQASTRGLSTTRHLFLC